MAQGKRRKAEEVRIGSGGAYTRKRGGAGEEDGFVVASTPWLRDCLGVRRCGMNVHLCSTRMHSSDDEEEQDRGGGGLCWGLVLMGLWSG